MVDKAVYLTIYELYFLLIQRDLHGLVIFEEIKDCIPDNQEMAQGVLSLMERGILMASEDGCYHLSEDMETVLDILDEAKSTYVINGYLQSCPMQCFYFSGSLCLVLQMDDFREGFVRVEVLDKTDAVHGLLDYEFMPDLRPVPDDMEMMPGEPEEFPEGMPAVCLPDMEIEDLLSDESVVMVVDQYLKNSIYRNTILPDRRAGVLSVEGTCFLTVSTGREVNAEMFSDESFFNIFVEA